MACGITGRNGSVQIKKESTWGTYITGDVALRVTSESINRTIENVEDPALIGAIYTSDLIKVSDGASGSMELSAHPDTLGFLANGVLGAESTISNPFKAAIIVNYNGSSLYARLTKSGSTLTAQTSANGSSWSADTNFNTTGSIDLSSASFDTFTELAAAIASYTGWDAFLVGDGTATSSTIADFAATEVFNNDRNWGALPLFALTTSTVAKMHSLYNAGSNVCLPSYSITVNRGLGTNKSLGFVGTKFSSLALSIANKDLVKLSVSLASKAEETDKTDISLTIPTIRSYTAANTKILIVKSDGTQVEFTEVKDLSLTINTNIDDNRVIGSLYTGEQTRQGSTIELSFTANNITTQYALRSEWINDSACEVWIYLEGTDKADTTNGIYYKTLIALNSVKLTAFNSPLSTPDRLTIDATGTVTKPVSTVNTNHIDIYHVDTITSVY